MFVALRGLLSIGETSTVTVTPSALPAPCTCISAPSCFGACRRCRSGVWRDPHSAATEKPCVELRLRVLAFDPTARGDVIFVRRTCGRGGLAERDVMHPVVTSPVDLLTLSCLLWLLMMFLVVTRARRSFPDLDLWKVSCLTLNVIFSRSLDRDFDRIGDLPMSRPRICLPERALFADVILSFPSSCACLLRPGLITPILSESIFGRFIFLISKHTHNSLE